MATPLPRVLYLEGRCLEKKESVMVEHGAFRGECGSRACICGFRSGALSFRVSPGEEACVPPITACEGSAGSQVHAGPVQVPRCAYSSSLPCPGLGWGPSSVFYAQFGGIFIALRRWCGSSVAHGVTLRVVTEEGRHGRKASPWGLLGSFWKLFSASEDAK